MSPRVPVILALTADEQGGALLADETREDALAAAIVAPSATLPEFAVVSIMREGVDTSDGRWFAPGGGTWREPPLTMTLNHDPDQRVGQIVRIDRAESVEALEALLDPENLPETYAAAVGDTGDVIVGLVQFDLGLDADGVLVDPEAPGRRAAREVHNGFLRGVSAELGDLAVEFECVESDPEDPEFCLDYQVRFLRFRIGAATFTSFQAMEDARSISVGGDPASSSDEQLRSIVASGVVEVREPERSIEGSDGESLSLDPPRDWFEDPGLDEPTPLTFEESGRVFGHIALWGTCHIGRTDVCVTPPRSMTSYAYFRTGEIVCADGTRVPVGSLTMNTGHATLDVSPTQAVAHYDDTGTQAAQLAAGEDDHGIWVAGVRSPNVTRDQLRVLMAAAGSGDWRRLGGNLELVRILAVNTPGFPVPRAQTLLASGEQTALVAAGAAAAASASCGCGGERTQAHGHGSDALERRLRNVEATLAVLGLGSQAAEALGARLSR
jgi:hypothetical protein